MKTHTSLLLLLAAFALSTLSACATNRGSSAAGDSLVQSDAAAAMTGLTVSDEPIESNSVTLVVHGMSCPLCATNVDKQLLSVSGVKYVSVNLYNGNIAVDLAESPKPTSRQLADAVERSGFTLKEIRTN